MKTMNIHDKKTKTSLRQVVDQLIKHFLQIELGNRNSIINNIPLKLYVDLNEDTVANVIRGMLHAMIVNVIDTVIYISAKEWYSNMIEVNVKDDQCYNTYAVALGLQDVVSKAESIGGQLDIINQKQKITTISFRFPVEQEAEDK